MILACRLALLALTWLACAAGFVRLARRMEDS